MDYVLSDIQEGDVYKFQTADMEKAIKWVEQKKKEWQEIAVAEYRLKREIETKFYEDGL